MSSDKLVDENDPSMWVAKRNLALVKFMKWFFFFLQGSYSQSHIKGRLWLKCWFFTEFHLDHVQKFSRNYCGIGSHSHFFWFCTTIPIDVYIRQASSSVSTRSIYWKSSLCNVFLNMSIWNLQYLKMQMGKRKLQGLLWQQTSGRHWNSWGMVKIFNPN